MEIKELKILTKYLDDILSNNKFFELRENDKNFKENEYVLLREYDNSSKSYLVRCVLIKILKVYNNLEKYGLMNGCCIFTFKILDVRVD